jgi:imidazolonepropionase-like amidohydrolase
VTAVRSAGDELDRALDTRKLVNSGEKQGAELFLTGPLIIDVDPHAGEIRGDAEAAILDKTMPKQQMDVLRKAGVDGIEARFAAGIDSAVTWSETYDGRWLTAAVAQAHAAHLPIVVRTGDRWDVENALRAHADGIEHRSFIARIPDEDFEAMQNQGVAFDPTLSRIEAARDFAEGKLDLLNRSLVQQVGPPALLAGTKNAIARAGVKQSSIGLDVAKDNLLRAYRHGVVLIAGSGAGNVMVFHGPTVQHELQLWVDAGIPVQVALNAATLNAAKALRAGARMGSVEKGKDATLLVVDGNPLLDIKATEAISFVMLKGERVDRAELLKPEP